MNWYREYIPGVSTTADPLNELTENVVPWMRTKECETSYQKLKDQLVNEPQQLASRIWIGLLRGDRRVNTAVGAVLS